MTDMIVAGIIVYGAVQFCKWMVYLKMKMQLHSIV